MFCSSMAGPVGVACTVTSGAMWVFDFTQDPPRPGLHCPGMRPGNNTMASVVERVAALSAR
jgi:hypothetical protein